MAGRTWVIAPDADTLRKRWVRLRDEKDADEKAKLFHPHLRNGKPGDKHVDKVMKEQLAGSPARTGSVSKDKGDVIEPKRYAFRSFDRQWVIPDARLLNQPNPTLWKTASDKQVYLTGLMAHSPTSGPALTISGLIPDLHHYKGSFGGRTFPLWSESSASTPNVPPALLTELAMQYGKPVTAPDLFAYIAAVAACPAYTERFRKQLKQPGLRIPLTADRSLFDEAAAIGRDVIWLHSFGDRFNEGRPAGPPRVQKDEPRIPAGGTLPSMLACGDGQQDRPDRMGHHGAW